MTNEELVNLIQSGVDKQENLYQLYDANRGLIFQIAVKIRRDEIEDLMQEGFFGIVKAAEHFDPSKEVPFHNYAPFWIKSSMLQYIEKGGGLVRLPYNRLERIRKYKKAVAGFISEYGKEPNPSELVDILGVSEIDIDQIKEDIKRLETDSLEKPLTDDMTLSDTIQADCNDIEDIERKIYNEELARVLWALVDSLEAVEANIIRRRYKDSCKYEQIGQELNITTSGARAKVCTALNHLKIISRPLEAFRDSDRYTIATTGGLNNFRRTHISPTERAAFKMLEVKK